MFNPLEHKGIALQDQIRSWRELNVEPIDPEAVDPYTRCRIITMNGIEAERGIGDKVVRSDRSAVPAFLLVRFCGPPPDPDVPVGRASGSPQAR
jgi:hypothetical protein